ncbi:hypothetical protein Tco_0833666 [Tanacetum coccineum]
MLELVSPVERSIALHRAGLCLHNVHRIVFPFAQQNQLCTYHFLQRDEVNYIVSFDIGVARDGSVSKKGRDLSVDQDRKRFRAAGFPDKLCI